MIFNESDKVKTRKDIARNDWVNYSALWKQIVMQNGRKFIGIKFIKYQWLESNFNEKSRQALGKQVVITSVLKDSHWTTLSMQAARHRTLLKEMDMSDLKHGLQ